MGDNDPPEELRNFACVEEYEELEQPNGTTTIHVTFWEQVEQMYTQLLEAIRMNGYEVIHFEPTANSYTDEYYEERNVDRADDTRISATFIETEPHSFYGEAWDWEDPPKWVDDLPL